MTEKKNLMQKMQKRIFGSSEHLVNNQDVIKATDSAPEQGFERKFKEIDNPSKMFSKRRKMLNIKRIFSLMKEIRITQKSLKKNPSKKEDFAKKIFFKELEVFTKSLDLLIGYTKLPREVIFKNHAVLYDNVIVLSMAMDKQKMILTPSVETGKMVMETYDELGIRTNKVAEFIRKQGFAAQACHPLGGSINYPSLAMLAGMGWHGRHGLIITPEFGPNHRLSAILTNITNLPFKEENPHAWIEEYCADCGRCIEKCPGKAIYKVPLIHADGRKTHIDMDKCFPVFSDEYGCSVCVKECMFFRVGYDKLKEKFDKQKLKK